MNYEEWSKPWKDWASQEFDRLLQPSLLMRLLKAKPAKDFAQEQPKDAKHTLPRCLTAFNGALLGRAYETNQ